MSADRRRNAFKATVDAYRQLHDDRQSDAEQRKANYTTLVNQYYDLATDFYEFGWGRSFHFAPRLRHESLRASLQRHERFLAYKLRLAPGMACLDVGCGVGGPMLYIGPHTGASIVGVNNNAYQIERGEKHRRRARQQDRCRFVKADFMQLPMEDDCFDAVYTIEASCHAPDRVALFLELRRVMKPGALFGGYEWCLTEAYDGESAEHRQIKKDIEAGDGLPDIASSWQIDEALRGAGFEVIESRDMAPTGDPETPWYLALTGKDRSLASLPRTPFGRALTNRATRLLERLRVAPEGTSQVSDFLNAGADALVAGGERGIFSPMYFFLARKPG